MTKHGAGSCLTSVYSLLPEQKWKLKPNSLCALTFNSCLQMKESDKGKKGKRKGADDEGDAELLGGLGKPGYMHRKRR